MATEEAALRQALVKAAEAVMDRTFVEHGAEGPWKAGKSQFNQLIGVCGEALCAEEVENYLRYQASRERPSWGLELAKHTIEKFNEAATYASDTAARVKAWRYYAVYLARAFTYRAKASNEGARARGKKR